MAGTKGFAILQRWANDKYLSIQTVSNINKTREDAKLSGIEIYAVSAFF